MSYAKIIGRNKEINILDRIYKSKKSELVAIYGRRRVGKSYLVSECFGKKIANSTSKCKITKCFCKSTPLVLRNSISFLVSH